MSPEAHTADRERRLDEVVLAYLQSADGGAARDRAGWLERHPELRDELAAYFAAEDHLASSVATLRRLSDGPIWGGCG